MYFIELATKLPKRSHQGCAFYNNRRDIDKLEYSAKFKVSIDRKWKSSLKFWTCSVIGRATAATPMKLSSLSTWQRSFTPDVCTECADDPALQCSDWRAAGCGCTSGVCVRWRVESRVFFELDARWGRERDRKGRAVSTFKLSLRSCKFFRNFVTGLSEDLHTWKNVFSRMKCKLSTTHSNFFESSNIPHVFDFAVGSVTTA